MGSSRTIRAGVRYETLDGYLSLLWQSDDSESDIQPWFLGIFAFVQSLPLLPE